MMQQTIGSFPAGWERCVGGLGGLETAETRSCHWTGQRSGVGTPLPALPIGKYPILLARAEIYNPRGRLVRPEGDRLCPAAEEDVSSLEAVTAASVLPEQGALPRALIPWRTLDSTAPAPWAERKGGLDPVRRLRPVILPGRNTRSPRQRPNQDRRSFAVIIAAGFRNQSRSG